MKLEFPVFEPLREQSLQEVEELHQLHWFHPMLLGESLGNAHELHFSA